jgi:hypothetical protein
MKTKSSRYRGVSRASRKGIPGKWNARVVIDGRPHHLGTFSREIDAARCYDDAVALYYPDHAAGMSNFQRAASTAPKAAYMKGLTTNPLKGF